MKEIKFNDKEKQVLAIIEKDGELNLTTYPKLKGTVLELQFKMVIERDLDKCITFMWRLTALGKKALEWNETVKLLQ